MRLGRCESDDADRLPAADSLPRQGSRSTQPARHRPPRERDDRESPGPYLRHVPPEDSRPNSRSVRQRSRRFPGTVWRCRYPSRAREPPAGRTARGSGRGAGTEAGCNSSPAVPNRACLRQRPDSAGSSRSSLAAGRSTSRGTARGGWPCPGRFRTTVPTRVATARGNSPSCCDVSHSRDPTRPQSGLLRRADRKYVART